MNEIFKKYVHSIGRRIKRRYLINKYHLKNVHYTFYLGGKGNISSDLKADAYVFIGPQCIIYPQVSIGAYSMLANNVSIIGGDHNFNKVGIPIIFSERENPKFTIIGADVWIGAHSIIMTGVEIGDGTIVAAGSVVTKNLEPFSIYAGVPARKVRNRFSTKDEMELHKEMLIKNPLEMDDKIKKFCEKLF